MLSRNSFDEESGLIFSRLARLGLPQILWLIALGLIILFVPLYFIGAALQDDVSSLQSELAPLETALASAPTPLPLATQVAQTTAVSATLLTDNINWPAAMNFIRTYNPSEITITGINQVDNQLFISGQAANDALVVAYARSLETSGAFKRVQVESIVVAAGAETPTPLIDTTRVVEIVGTTTAVPGVPTVSPTPTITSTPLPTWTPTPDLRDDFEWDDTVAKTLFLNDIQRHNFYPTFDVDLVTFLAKAGRTYRVYTQNLTAGVDTFLTVSHGETTLTNDDASLGTLASSVTVQAPDDADISVLVRITNRGAYGADKYYQVLVQEIVPTVTPTSVPVTPSTPTLTPTLTNTAVSTNTPIPSTPPTATPDLRDDFEPDEVDAPLIAVGETQAHSFYPTSDGDNVQFAVKGERVYEVQTSELAVGIDTKMVVSLGETSWENDDYAPSGSGNFASAVCFTTTAEQDGETAVIHLENVTPQFEPDKYYTLSLVELPDLQLNVEQLDFTLASDATEPATELVALTATNVVSWTAVSDTPWLSLDLLTGTTPANLTVSANSTDLAEGLHEGSITFSWSTVCEKEIPVTLNVTAPASSSLNSDWQTANKPAVNVGKRTAFQGKGLVEFVIVVELGD
ncbi:MAG: hypothetical protein DWQ04_15075 [Chloroflexi bacterium]|nr:MAG: hypothetical protein DWQ04_15075 [Chloroflexota bacterium]